MRILQVSDLHFGKHNEALAKDLELRVKEIKPDILVATGDLVNTPDDGLFKEAYAFLMGLGTSCSTSDGSAAVIAIPGNHDMWDVGLFGGPFRPKYSDTFGQIPTQHYFKKERVWIWGFDSASKRKLATGQVRDDELIRFNQDYAALKAADPSFAADAFKIALIHHHPLPVNWDTDWQQQLLMMTNAGTFLSAMLSHNMNLVLHGHEHLQGRARLSSSLGGGNNAELVVVSLGATLRTVSNPATNWFNIITLGPPGDPKGRAVTVESIPSIGLNFAPKGEVYTVQSPAQGREIAFGSSKREAGFVYSEVASIADLNLDGDCHRSVECERMEILSADSPRALRHEFDLPATSGYIDLVEVTVPPGSPYLGIYRDESALQTTKNQWTERVSIYWGTGVKLSPGDKVDYQYRWWALNSFALDAQQFRMKHAAPASVEFTHFPVMDPIRDLLVVVRFPKGFVPASKPQIRVTKVPEVRADSRTWERMRDLEQELRAKNAIRYIDSLGVAALRVHLPQKGYCYGIEWSLPELNLSEPDPKVHQLKCALLAASRNPLKVPLLTAIANELGKITIEELIPHWTDPIEVICMLFDDDQRKLVSVSAAAVSSQAVIPLDKPNVQFDYGVGIAGRAFKGNEGRLYLHSEVKNQNRKTPNHYYPLAGEKAHNVLMCLPLRSPKVREHVYGVLNISSPDPDCPLRDTAAETGPIPEAKIGDFLEAVNDCVYVSMQALEKAHVI
jgi:predicted MPP superfamily phosphohydrolase